MEADSSTCRDDGGRVVEAGPGSGARGPIHRGNAFGRSGRRPEIAALKHLLSLLLRIPRHSRVDTSARAQVAWTVPRSPCGVVLQRYPPMMGGDVNRRPL